ncbi:MAG: enoyl-CoA hydratase/isomerase family protein [Acidimicrobiales bacterium]
MTHEVVHYELVENVAIITLDDPKKRNALSREMRSELRQALIELDRDKRAAVGVVTGNGPAFCAGADLKEMSADTLAVPPRDYVPMIGHNLWLDKVLIAAVNGPALGGGFLIAQMADLAVAAEEATFGMPEARWGRGAPWSVPLAQKIPERIWMELAVTGEPIGAKRAYEIGLLNLVVPLTDLMPATMALASKVARNAPLTVQATRRMVHLSAEMGRSAAWEVADRLFEPVYESADAQEGPRAFKERRQPRWTGS